MKIVRTTRHVGAALLVLVLAGCATQATRLDQRAADDGLEVVSLRGGVFTLRAYAKASDPAYRGPSAGRDDVLHVYLEGDGLPWVSGGTTVAASPHGRRHVAYELMRLDPAPSVYLKRPCYQDPKADGPCHPLLWTHLRYSETVVSAMEAALRAHLAASNDGAGERELVWFGYSGGGVLAMLLAPRFEETRAVVTLAANLDVAAWTAHHGYTELEGSLDPALEPQLPADIVQLHLAAGRDENVPARLLRSAVERQAGAELLVYDDFDHTCCWAEVWPEILRRVDGLVGGLAGGLVDGGGG